MIRSTRSSSGTPVGQTLSRSKKQEKELQKQQDRVSSRKTKATGAAGDVNSQCYDFKSITIDKVKQITSNEETYQELKSLVGQSTITSLYMKLL